MELESIRRATEAAYMGNWRDVPIVECGEPLVKVDEGDAHSWYHRVMSLTDTPDVYLRQGTYEKFLAARNTLRGAGYDLKVYDGWRPINLQENLFWHYLVRFTAVDFGLASHFVNCQTSEDVKAVFKEMPEAVRTAMDKANRNYVSWPSSNPAQPSPHSTGGAVDVWLFEDGKPADLGVDFDWMEDNAGVFHHLMEAPTWTTSGDDSKIQLNRELLIGAMHGAGFSLYPYEVWHYNDGNQMDAVVTGGPARYGYIQP